MTPSPAHPVCAICGERTHGLTVSVRMTHGVTLWLCRAHASPEYQARNDGRDMVDTLACLWEAHGCLTAARRGALEAHLARFAERPQRPRLAQTVAQAGPALVQPVDRLPDRKSVV